jgi:hypothetical protein
VIIARIERIDSSESQTLHNEKVFRIIEVLPSNAAVWNGASDEGLVHLIHGVLSWAIEQGCIASDFYCSSRRLAPVLLAAGFREQNYDRPLPECAMVSIFQPLNYQAKPINALYRIETARNTLMQIDFADVYQVKSDNDMDRPNRLDSDIVH